MSRKSSQDMEQMPEHRRAYEDAFCRGVHSRLHAFLDSECGSEERRFLEEHVHKCPQCLEEFGSEQAIRRLLYRCCQRPAPEDLRQCIATRIRVSCTRVEYRR